MKVFVGFLAIIIAIYAEKVSEHSLPEENDVDVFEAIKSTQEFVNIISKNPRADVEKILALNEVLNLARSLAVGGSISDSNEFRADQSDSCESLKKQIDKLKADIKAGQQFESQLAFQMQAAQVMVSVVMAFARPSPNKFNAAFKKVQQLANVMVKMNAEKRAQEELLATTEALAMVECNSDAKSAKKTATTMKTPARFSPIDCTRSQESYNSRGIYLKSICWINQTIDYEGAEDYCRVKGMHLFAITKKDEYRALQAFSKDNIKANDVWLNGRQAEDGSWWVQNPDKKPLLREIWPTKTYSRWNGFLHYGNYEGPFTPIGGFRQANKTFVCEFKKLSEEEKMTTEDVPSFSFLTFYEESTTTFSPPSTQRCPGCLPILNFCALPSSSDCTCVAGREKVQCIILGPNCCK